jgi:hypothetical protein
MKIRMLVEKTGPRYDTRSWPAAGAEIDVPDDEGAALCAQGDAAPVARAADDDVEMRAEAPAKKPVRPSK